MLGLSRQGDLATKFETILEGGTFTHNRRNNSMESFHNTHNVRDIETKQNKAVYTRYLSVRCKIIFKFANDLCSRLVVFFSSTTSFE